MLPKLKPYLDIDESAGDVKFSNIGLPKNKPSFFLSEEQYAIFFLK